MLTREVTPGLFDLTTDLPGRDPQLLCRQGKRPGRDGAVEKYAIVYFYRADGTSIEQETIEITPGPIMPDDAGAPRRLKRVVRENYNEPAQLFLRPTSRGGEKVVNATLKTLGYTIEGGEGDDPREPWMRYIIEDPASLERAFGDIDTAVRQRNDTGTYVVLKCTPDQPLMLTAVRVVGGRLITINGVGEITVTFGPDTAEGRCGPMLAAYLRKVTWIEGDPSRPQGMM